MSKSSLNSERILITGGADGLGKKLALGYSLRGAEVVILDVDRAKGAEIAQLPGMRFVAIDLGDFDPEALDFGDHGSFDIILLNAGISAFGNFAEIPWEQQQAVLNINLIGHLKLLQRLLAKNQLKDGGKLAFVLSAAAFTPIPVTATYAASKAALEAFGHSLEPWLMHRKISVSLIYPGQMQTAHLKKYYGNEDLKSGVDPSLIAKRVIRGIDARKRHIYPDSISKAFRFLTWSIPWAMPTLIYRFNRKRFADLLYPDPHS